MTVLKYANRIIFTLLAVSFLQAEASTDPVEPASNVQEQHTTTKIDNCIPENKWWIPAEKRTLPEKELLNNISRQQVILLGEHHNNIAHHRWHLKMVTSLYSINKNIVLGFEMFPRRLQPVLDEWVAGKLEQAEFISKLDWDTIWGFDIALYMPVFEFAKKYRIPMFALNVNSSLVDNVRDKGWEAIPESEREGLSDPAAPSKGYLSILAASYLQHNPINQQNADPESEAFKKADGEKFYLFVQGQLLWDRAMAEGVETALAKSENSLFIGMMGSWHIIYRYGVPHQLSSLGITNTVVLVPWDNNFICSQITPTFADVIYGTPSNQ